LPCGFIKHLKQRRIHCRIKYEYRPNCHIGNGLTINREPEKL
jgi:hypothetical protein